MRRMNEVQMLTILQQHLNQWGMCTDTTCRYKHFSLNRKTYFGIMLQSTYLLTSVINKLFSLTRMTEHGNFCIFFLTGFMEWMNECHVTLSVQSLNAIFLKLHFQADVCIPFRSGKCLCKDRHCNSQILLKIYFQIRLKM